MDVKAQGAVSLLPYLAILAAFLTFGLTTYIWKLGEARGRIKRDIELLDWMNDRLAELQAILRNPHARSFGVDRQIEVYRELGDFLKETEDEAE